MFALRAFIASDQQVAQQNAACLIAIKEESGNLAEYSVPLSWPTPTRWKGLRLLPTECSHHLYTLLE